MHVGAVRRRFELVHARVLVRLHGRVLVKLLGALEGADEGVLKGAWKVAWEGARGTSIFLAVLAPVPHELCVNFSLWLQIDEVWAMPACSKQGLVYGS